jgi:predicted HAD superfamily Cof-like phosphohydrolase
MASHYEKVKHFTNESGYKDPEFVEPMTKEQILFLIRMLLEESQELLTTVITDGLEVKAALMNLTSTLNHHRKIKHPTNKLATIADQVDALVDMEVYINNVAARRGYNMDSVFEEVHKANMAKRSSDGTFIRDPHGKILKPTGWTPPDIEAVVQKWPIKPDS